MKPSFKSKIVLQPMLIRKDNKHYIVENEVNGDFFEMPEVCVVAIEKINNNESLASIEEQLKQSFPDEEVDIIDFIEQLIDLGLVKELDGVELTVQQKSQSTTGFTWISSKLASVFYNKITVPILLILFISNLLLFITQPQLLPKYTDIFIFDSMVLSTITFTLISTIIIVLHEFGHIFAIRSFDLPANVQIGNRLFFIVVETDLTAGWRLSAKERNILFLGGMFIDQIILAVALTLKLTIFSEGGFIDGLLSIVILDIFVKTIYQCCIYMKTDLYYVLESVTGSYNLMENGKNYLARWLPFLKVDKTTTVFDGEEKIVKLYSIFTFIGVAFTISLFFFFFLPQTVYIIISILPHLTNPVGNPLFWDALVMVVEFIVMISLLLIVLIKKKKASS
ncbi:peptidase [Gracilibacillus sp. S3-1-1]|uniref:Peptidase n=1 Tax=Gracilibacillus pellucidus TaxID=3095368 RepID=A0ACC6M4G3_9BACI|nr:peptidase [Gracilibacillus sp. S3-1-1]MDX8045855.1 peptidase [Gracilibacillus sp. S3-1-1]